MEKVNGLLKIWDQISSNESETNYKSQDEFINKFIDLTKIGDSFYIIFNTKTAQLEFVSDQITTVLGYQAEEFTIEKILSYIHTDDLPYFFEYERSAVEFFNELESDQRLNYKFAYDFRIKNKAGEYKRILQQVNPFLYFKEGGAKTLVIMTDCSHFQISGIPKLSFIGMNGAPSFYNYFQDKALKKSIHPFSVKEMEIIKLLVAGNTSKEIAQKLNRSVFTIHNHRKNILQKSECSTMQELVAKSIREGWL